MMWFTADFHFNHPNIIKFCHRPFNNIEHMNRELIKRWNERVKPGDFIYVIGDFIYSGNYQDVFNIINQLNGNILLLRGDHDRAIRNDYANEKLFILPQLYQVKFPEIEAPMTLCHYKMTVWPRSHYNTWHLYAHSHGRLPSEGKSHDVGVDNNNFYPISLTEIIEIMKIKPDNFNLVKPEEKKARKQFEQLNLDLSWPDEAVK